MNNRRRIYIINPGYQLKFIALFLCVSGATLAAAVFFVVRLIYSALEGYRYTSHIGIAHTGEFVIPLLLKVNSLFLSANLLLMLLLAWFFSRRATLLAEAVSGRIDEIKKGNLAVWAGGGEFADFPELGASMEAMAAETRAKVGSIRNAAAALRERIKAGDDKSGVREAASRLKYIAKMFKIS